MEKKVIIVETYLPYKIKGQEKDLHQLIEKLTKTKIEDGFEYDLIFFCEDEKVTINPKLEKVLVCLIGESTEIQNTSELMEKLKEQEKDILVAYHRGNLGILEDKGKGYDQIAKYVSKAVRYSHEIGSKYPFWTNFIDFVLAYTTNDKERINRSNTEMIKAIEEDEAGIAPFRTPLTRSPKNKA